ncbi:MAG: hypothetical protein A2821_03085 [Candidatus Magasanikbacteria bacterium RIFCSPHIGHO2_01_FULL_41_23]|uniref:Nucleotidyl transferase domain-containing protein n=1 Tax=Candidatus Magasanikbacteria bacterium RIFCSPLOWO2_01_FULL_40_15 TaxID=1798686 RepID=A0A1F6N3H9_9BACT|nr:MAG: hypothetical protein A2821_03085 [Candidatus Magasanikbacteria bacterium RIFCSPHIGHO2_01_FULL_41_23]OGH67322.1 MAG: hypothetical protein A3C66_01100 [Candidatus Magasanikbacteria bacterium RIFCSPHIGHO2_02_FULL_41_35]OGH76547.1 MAG: hypothetical protein A3F22_00310 [Candidatus Magasanikbacteria bacterium RIFCSPHIGHO2_12_FULL_41_16]OGH78467.1 MAG: hypothetical protein A2983_03045 [Candidatus Magasanikbacteria bacterium RIFCSPLOWO2_01_FULL_40_15]
MKVVILAAGEGRRMLPLTLKIPKPLLRIGNKTILDYIFDALPEEIDSVIVVVGYLKKKIQQHLGNRYQGRSIRYVTQSILDGSATALLTTKDFFLPSERFLIIYGDELPTKQEVSDCLSHEFTWLCSPAEHPRQSGIATIASDGRIIEVIEKPENPISNLSAAGIMVVDSTIFNYRPVQHSNGEFYLTSLMNQFLQSHSVQVVYGNMRPAFVSPDELQKISF